MGHAEGMYIRRCCVVAGAASAGLALARRSRTGPRGFPGGRTVRPGCSSACCSLAFCVVSLLTNNSPWPATVVVPADGVAHLLRAAVDPQAGAGRHGRRRDCSASRSRCRGRGHRRWAGAPGDVGRAGGDPVRVVARRAVAGVRGVPGPRLLADLAGQALGRRARCGRRGGACCCRWRSRAWACWSTSRKRHRGSATAAVLAGARAAHSDPVPHGVGGPGGHRG